VRRSRPSRRQTGEDSGELARNWVHPDRVPPDTSRDATGWLLILLSHLQVDIRADDFPRETIERLEVCSKHTALLDLVAAKDRILLQLLKEREELLVAAQHVRTGKTATLE